jgi:hypothetical protein
MSGYNDDISGLSDSRLIERFYQVLGDIRVYEAQLESENRRRQRSQKVFRGTLLNFVGLVAAVPTGGVTLVLCAAGMLDWADAIVDDAKAINQQMALRRAYNEEFALLSELREELRRRGLA